MGRPAKQLDPALYVLPSPAEANALQALHHGRADEHQQRRALDFILQKACRAFSTTFDRDPRVAALFEGRRQAGLIIINATRTSTEALKALEDQQKEST